VEACQNVQVNETLTVAWDREIPRILWDGGEQIEGSSCVSCGHCVTVCPCNALMEKSMLGEAGYLTNTPASVLDTMIEVVKSIEPSTGYPPILALSEVEAEMRHARVKKTKTVCTYCGDGCSFDMWTKDRHILKVEPSEGAANGISTCVKGKFGWDFANSPDRLRKPLKRVSEIGPTGAKHETFVEIEWDEALTLIATEFTRIKQTYGPDSLAFIEVYERRELPDDEAGARGGRHEQRGQLQPLLPDACEQRVEPHGRYWRRFGVDLGY
jgi:formate dehydrogenase major subunit